MENHRPAAHAADALAFTSGNARAIGVPVQLAALADAILNGTNHPHDTTMYQERQCA